LSGSDRRCDASVNDPSNTKGEQIMTNAPRQKVLITGAAGGMGRACARLFGLTYDLVLNDIAAAGLETFAGELERDAFVVSAAIAGDTCDPSVLERIATALGGGKPFAVVHTAGLSPSMADWREIMRVNLVGTVKLMEALEPLVVPGTVAILVASTAGHGIPALPEIKSVMSDALAPDFLDRMAPFIAAMESAGGPAGAPGISYSLSKKGVLNLGECKAAEWGGLGGRVMTISPGLILTPMGRQEVERTQGAKALLDAAPIGRAGTAMDIAMTARFLASNEASFLTGSDILVDGGSTSAMRIRSVQASGWRAAQG
jgi:NAD(P)-dependent dehydrogenase (short-subunit alcohol dehydrogenase family)